MDNVLALPDNMPIAVYDENTLSDLSKTGDWLPRIVVTTSNSDLVQMQKLPMGRVASIDNKDAFKDLGTSVDLILCAWRPRALRLPVGLNPISYFDPKDPEFIKTQQESFVKDSRCIYGPEFLVWIPAETRFGLFHLSSKSSRKEGQKALIIMKGEDGKLRPGAATVKPKFIQTPKFKWWSPELLPCSTPLSPLPEAEKFAEELTKFQNPPKQQVEKAEPAVSGGRER